MNFTPIGNNVLLCFPQEDELQNGRQGGCRRACCHGYRSSGHGRDVEKAQGRASHHGPRGRGTSGPVKEKPFVHVTPVDFLRRGVVTLCGSLEELDGVVGKPSASCSREHAAILKKDWKTLRGLLERERDTDASGVALQENGFPDVFVWLPKWSSGTAVHELYHAVSMMCDNAGIHDDETGAYLMEYLFNDLVLTEEDRP